MVLLFKVCFVINCFVTMLFALISFKEVMVMEGAFRLAMLPKAKLAIV